MVAEQVVNIAILTASLIVSKSPILADNVAKGFRRCVG
jgi:hypothetical protein